MRPDYTPPKARLLRPLRWRHAQHSDHGKIVELWSLRQEAWSRQLPWTGVVHECLEDGLSFDETADRVRPALGPEVDVTMARRRTGTYLFSLMEDGYVEMDFGEPPKRFTERFEVVKELGRGGVGVAWLCQDHELGRDVVVKHAWDYFVARETADRLMRQEDEVLHELDHPGIIKRFDAFEIDDTLHLVREFVDGTPLSMEPSDDDGFVKRANELISIIGHLHDRGWLLLDLRPANFYVRNIDDSVALVDVGICVRHNGIGAEHELRLRKSFGSPGYSAPETRKRHRASTASDVYGLGRLLFALRAGRSPLKQWNATELRRELADDPWAALVSSMCEQDPKERPRLDGVSSAFSSR